MGDKLEMVDVCVEDWMNAELTELSKESPSNYEKRPTMKFVENVIAEVVVDLSKKFESKSDKDQQGRLVTKAIIPVLHGGVGKNWWLNKKNPVYREILKAGAGRSSLLVKVLQTGSQDKTKYILVK